MITYKLIDGHKANLEKILSSAENPNDLDWSKCIGRIRWSVWAVIQPCACDPGYGKIVARVDLTGFETPLGTFRRLTVESMEDVKKEISIRADFSGWEDELSMRDGPIIEVGEGWRFCDAEV